MALAGDGMQFTEKQRRLGRLRAEAHLVANRYGVNVRYDKEDGTWFHIARLPIPAGWNHTTADILIDIPHGTPGYPQVAPQWFWTNRDLMSSDGRPIGHFFKLGQQSVDQKHWERGFGHFCIYMNNWQASGDTAIESGDNLLSYLHIILQVFHDKTLAQ